VFGGRCDVIRRLRACFFPVGWLGLLGLVGGFEPRLAYLIRLVSP
jgi:hypothetical protein